MPNRFVPVDHAIVGIVDAVEEIAGVRAPTQNPKQNPKRDPKRPRKGA
jgi:hypothetical protein